MALMQRCGTSGSVQHARPSSANLLQPSMAAIPRAGASRRSVSAQAAQEPEQSSTSRRDLLTTGASFSALVLSGLYQMPALAEEGAEVIYAAPSTSGEGAEEFTELVDPILAYKFKYPTRSVSGKPLKMLLSHEPEKYSSAAPLTADARQRIVCELLDLNNFISISIAVGPASGVLKTIPPESWKPYDVALTVLVDRSTSRMTTGQRRTLNDVEEVHAEDRDGTRYVVYEHLSQGSPTVLENARKETYRHAYAVTTMRPDNEGTPFLYTLNVSCREVMWDDLQPLFKETIQSFALLPPTENYVSPDTNSWQFW
eukprot:CAMPEP_0119108856 /NCGR_PEP_ID=MMETSP1180-20130426/15788_1 /TAXON_ID=3052 ORGANISM="Chlamydomonas cf sp, Strain CCMP681" /NCGR_SAMPLE_ID=MMETSP1180 /ASSEMBLY_ACC=CAM_ASM_000741 /LENGTH=312 /DNA_ID=CAMNT_0007094523 /DNA_START=21 /DNA_END=959 /DNA_ORIENTATION=+